MLQTNFSVIISQGASLFTDGHGYTDTDAHKYTRVTEVGHSTWHDKVMALFFRPTHSRTNTFILTRTRCRSPSLNTLLLLLFLFFFLLTFL